MSNKRKELNNQVDAERVKLENLVTQCTALVQSYTDEKSSRTSWTSLVTLGFFGSNAPNEDRIAVIRTLTDKLGSIETNLQKIDSSLKVTEAPSNWQSTSVATLQARITAYTDQTNALLDNIMLLAADIARDYNRTSPENSALYRVLKQIVTNNDLMTEEAFDSRIKDLKSITPATEESKEEAVESTSPTSPAV